ncbi:MAG TPA: hypothetical protein VFE70_01580, partial [Candidatus Elarobacter sp.]|nr:hypothetical protein [Candidatus Elarobacter sp.]
MARVRRKPSARMRWNLEIAGIVALGFALLLGIALVAPAGRTGAAGGATAFALHALFGAGAGLFIVLIALVAAIVFLEINVPQMIATLGGAACAYFVVLDLVLAASGHDGGLLGGALDRGLRALLGDAGVWIVVIVAVLAVTVAITGVSLKRVIGWCVARLAALRSSVAQSSLREAFHFPALPARPAAAPEPVRFYDHDGEDEELDEADGADEEAEYDDEDDAEYTADDGDDDDDDAGEEDDDVTDEPDDEAPGELEWDVQDRRPVALPVVSGEYEDALTRRPSYVLPDVAAIFDPPQLQKA